MADDKKPAPVFDLTIGRNSSECVVHVNGVDITSALSGFVFECQAGGLTKATLITRPGKSRATVQAALEDVTVIEEPVPMNQGVV